MTIKTDYLKEITNEIKIQKNFLIRIMDIYDVSADEEDIRILAETLIRFAVLVESIPRS